MLGPSICPGADRGYRFCLKRHLASELLDRTGTRWWIGSTVAGVLRGRDCDPKETDVSVTPPLEIVSVEAIFSWQHAETIWPELAFRGRTGHLVLVTPAQASEVEQFLIIHLDESRGVSRPRNVQPDLKVTREPF